MRTSFASPPPVGLENTTRRSSAQRSRRSIATLIAISLIAASLTVFGFGSARASAASDCAPSWTPLGIVPDVSGTEADLVGMLVCLQPTTGARQLHNGSEMVWGISSPDFALTLPLTRSDHSLAFHTLVDEQKMVTTRFITPGEVLTLTPSTARFDIEVDEELTALWATMALLFVAIDKKASAGVRKAIVRNSSTRQALWTCAAASWGFIKASGVPVGEDAGATMLTAAGLTAGTGLCAREWKKAALEHKRTFPAWGNDVIKIGKNAALVTELTENLNQAAKLTKILCNGLRWC